MQHRHAKQDLAIPPPRQWPARLTQFAFLLTVAVVIARCAMIEIVRDPTPITPGSDAVPRTAGPTTSLVLDMLLCVPSLLILLRGLLEPAYRPRTAISHVLFGLMALWAAASTLWASDKFSAMIAAAHILAAATLMWSMTQLVRCWLRVRLVAAICFGILLIYVAHGAFFQLVDVPDNIKFWQEHGPQELARRGWEPGSFAAIQFEKKITSGEMIGFNASPNSFAAMIVLLGIVSAGVAIQRICDRDEAGWPAAIIIALITAVWILVYTRSRTAFITPVLAGGILAMLGLLRNVVARHRRAVYFAVAAAIVVGAAFLVAHGIRYGTLFHDSLSFRWRYWIGAARVFELHPVRGVGWANFGKYYLGVRLPAASEEIQDPHNLLVRAFAELGTIGGLLMIAWLARLWWEMTLSSKPATIGLDTPMDRPPLRDSPGGSYDGAATAKAIFAIAGAALLINVAASVDFSLNSADQQWYIALELLKRLLYLGLMLLGLALAALQSSQRPCLDQRPAPWVLWAMITGLGMFLVHNLIDFSLFETGPMFLFAMLVGATIGARRAQASAQACTTTRWPAIASLLAGTAAWVATWIVAVAPVALAEGQAQRGDEQVRLGHPASGAALLSDAMSQLWICNADYAYRAATASQYARAAPAKVQSLLDRAVHCDPMNTEYYRTRADFALRQPQPDLRQAFADYEKALTLNPNDVSGHLDFAKALASFGQRQRAIEQYEQALKMNDLLDPAEPKRLRPQQIEIVRQSIQQLRLGL